MNTEDVMNCPFYQQLKEGVRLWVFRLRNRGINTTCSCHHNGTIQCDTMDPTREIREIKTVMFENGVPDNFSISVHFNGTRNEQWLEIRSPAFEKSIKS
jgi:hypothetical protein